MRQLRPLIKKRHVVLVTTKKNEKRKEKQKQENNLYCYVYTILNSFSQRREKLLDIV